MNDDRKRMTEAIQQYRELVKQKDKIEIRLWLLGRFIRATAGILPDEDRPRVEKKIASMFGRAPGVTEAVQMALRSHRGKWMSAPAIRDYLKEMGFDFSNYTGNPLTSIHIVAQRIHEVQANGSGDEKSYRWKGK
jgi:hypothetical protein